MRLTRYGLRRSAGTLVALGLGLVIGAGIGRPTPAPAPVAEAVVAAPSRECQRVPALADRVVIRAVAVAEKQAGTLEAVIASASEADAVAALQAIGPTIDELGSALGAFERAVDRYQETREGCVQVYR